MNCDVCSKAPNSAISCKNYFPYLTLVKKSHWKGFIFCLPLFLFRARIGLFLKTTIFIQSAGDKKKKKKQYMNYIASAGKIEEVGSQQTKKYQ